MAMLGMRCATIPPEMERLIEMTARLAGMPDYHQGHPQSRENALWSCEWCGGANHSARVSCEHCGAPRVLR